jgi:hypothetical protein
VRVNLSSSEVLVKMLVLMSMSHVVGVCSRNACGYNIGGSVAGGSEVGCSNVGSS